MTTNKIYKIRIAPVVEKTRETKLNYFGEAVTICNAIGILANQQNEMDNAIKCMRARFHTEDYGAIFMVVHLNGVLFRPSCKEAKDYTEKNIGRQNVYNVIRVQWWGNGNITIKIN